VSRASGARSIDPEVALRALAHPGRRRVLELVAGQERTSGELAVTCRWTPAAASQHLRVLRDAALVEVRRDGTRRLYSARREGLAQLRAFLDAFWAERLGNLGDHVAAAQQASPRRRRGDRTR
jgi:DNA-binding transcriptional ArsR family regulator